MTGRSLLPEAIEQYVAAFHPETPVEARLRAETGLLPDAGMQIGPDQAHLMALLVKLTGTRRALEVGTFTGYSALAVASALPSDGQLITCDLSEEWTAMARRYWAEAGVGQKIELRLGPAAGTLETLIKEGGEGSFDFAFIDADKASYDVYYELILRLVRPQGVILLDNMLWNGKVLDLSVQDEDTRAIRALSAKIQDDRRVESCFLTVGDGVVMVRKRQEPLHR